MIRVERPRNCAVELHAECLTRPLDEGKIKALVNEHPLSVEVRGGGDDNWLPIHRVCRREPSVSLVRCLVKAFPDSVNHWTCDKAVEWLGARLPIHIACQFGASLEVVKFLAQVQPQTIEVRSLYQGKTPLDYAKECWEEYHLPSTREVIEWLESSNPAFLPLNSSSLPNSNEPSTPMIRSGGGGQEASIAETSRAPSESGPRLQVTEPSVFRTPPEGSGSSRRKYTTGLDAALKLKPLSHAAARREASGSTAATGAESSLSSYSSEFASCAESEPASSSSENGTVARFVPPPSVQTRQSSIIFFNNSLKVLQRESRKTKYSERLKKACLEEPPSLVFVTETLKKCKDAAKVPCDYMKHIPLHLACLSGASRGVIQALVEAWPDSVKIANKEGYLPLHLCFTGKIASLDVVCYLLSHYPGAVFVNAGREKMLPLHCARRFHASASVIRELEKYTTTSTEEEAEGSQ